MTENQQFLANTCETCVYLNNNEFCVDFCIGCSCWKPSAMFTALQAARDEIITLRTEIVEMKLGKLHMCGDTIP